MINLSIAIILSSQRTGVHLSIRTSRPTYIVRNTGNDPNATVFPISPISHHMGFCLLDNSPTSCDSSKGLEVILPCIACQRSQEVLRPACRKPTYASVGQRLESPARFAGTIYLLIAIQTHLNSCDSQKLTCQPSSPPAPAHIHSHIVTVLLAVPIRVVGGTFQKHT